MNHLRGAVLRHLSLLMLCLAMAVAASAGVIPPGGPILVDSFTDFGGDTTPGDNVCAFVPSGGQCTLRAAIMEANARTGPDTIILPPGIYTLAIAGTGENNALTGDLDITGDLTIIGSNGNESGGRSGTIVEAGSITKGGIDRVFHVNPSAAGAANVTFKALTVRNGAAPGSASAGYGGGIAFEANGPTSSLTLFNVAVVDNKTAGASGLQGGTGGGIDLYNVSTAPATVLIEKSLIDNNETTRSDGGGLFAFGINLTIRDSEIANNLATWSSGNASGGGMVVDGTGSTVTIERSLFASNRTTSVGRGGALAIYGSAPAVTIRNSTFSGNEAGSNGGGVYLGSASGVVTMTNVTMTANRAGSGGGALRVAAGTATLTNTIAHGNSALSNPDIEGPVAAASSYNIIGTGAGGLTNGVAGNRIGVDPLLGALADNGGPTRTHRLLPGSPAMDAGTNGGVASFDQRGFARIVDAADADSTATADIGALEAHPTISDIANQNGIAGLPIAVPFYVGDATQALTITAASSNQSVVPNGSLALTNSGTHNPTLTLTGTAPGTATITVTVSGGGRTAVDTFDVTLTGAADLTIQKSHAGTLRQGLSGTYTITVANAGTLESSGTVTVTDTLPAALTATALSGTGWTCDVGSITCTRSDALAAGASWPPITLTVDIIGSRTTTNVANVSGGGDANLANNSASDTTFITPACELEVTISAPATLVPGETSSHTVAVRNLGPSASSNVNLIANATPGITYTGITGADWNCSWSATSVMCTRSALAVSVTSAITATFTVDSAAPAQVTVTSSVLASNDFTREKSSDSRTIAIVRDPDLTLTKTHTGDFRQGGSGEFTITATNSGLSATSGTVTVVDMLPAALTATAMSGTGWTCDLATLTCTTTDVVAAGASFPPITLTVDVAADAPSSVVNLATVSGGGEVATGNNEAMDGATVTQVADLVPAVVSVGGAFAQGDIGRSYEVYVENVGDAMSDSAISMAMTLSPGLTFSSVTPQTGWTCTDAPLVCSTTDPIWPGAGTFLVATITVDVAVDAPTPVSLTATVSGGGEAVTSNDVSTATTNVIQMPDLVIAKTHAGDLSQGGFATYTIRVTNAGSADTSGNVIVTDAPPSELAVTAIGGDGWNCDLMALSCFRSDPLAPGASYPDITLAGNVDIAAPATITNSASVSGTDRDSSNNTAVDVADVLPPADLTISKTAPAALYAGQTGAQYTLVVSNLGAVPTAGEVVVTEAPPAGLTVIAMSGSGWVCDTSTCRRSDALLPAASFDSITVTVDVAEAATGTITNSATVSGGNQLRVDNDLASAPADVQSVTFLLAALPAGQVGFAYDQSIAVAGYGVAPYAFTIFSGALPAGLSLAPDGRIAGVPTAGGTFTFTVQATDSAPAPGTFAVRKTWTLTIAPASISVIPETLPNAAFNTPYTATISAIGGTAPHRFSAVGTLPAGLTLDASGVLSGTATEVGMFTFTVLATDSSSGTGPYGGSRAYMFAVTKSDAIVSVSAPEVAFGSDGTMIVTVSSPAGTIPTGTVELFIDGVPAGTQVLASGTATFTMSSPVAGWYPLYVAYSGDATHRAAAGVAVLSVRKATPAITIDAPSIVFGDAATVTVTIPNATGNVDLTVGTFAQTQPLAGGVATFTFSGVDAGWQMTFATYAGDANVYSGMKSTYLFVEKAATSSSIVAPTIDYGADASITVTVSSAAGEPTGSVTLSVDGGAPLSATLAGGTASFTVPGLTAGDHTLAATYPGSDDYATSSANATIQINQAASSLTIDAPSIVFGDDAVVTVTATSADTPAGEITLTVDGIEQTQPLVSGAATFTIAGLDAGTWPIALAYAGDANHLASSASATLEVSKAPTSFSIAAAPIVFGTDATITVTTTSGTPSGTVDVTVDGATQTESLVSGAATFTFSGLDAGTWPIALAYAGDENHLAGTAAGTVVVSRATSAITITNVAPSPSVVGATVTISFTATADDGNVTIATGAYSCSAAVSAGSCTITFDAAGSYDLIATYAGSANYEPSASAPFTHAVEHPVGHAIVSGDATICAGEESTIFVELTGTEPWTLTWSDGFVETIASPRHQRVVRVEGTTVYTLTSATDAHQAMSVEGSAQVTVREPLDAPEISGPSSVAAGESFTLAAERGYDAYQWYREGSVLGGETSRTLRIESATSADFASYTVIGFANGCTSPRSRAFRVSESEPAPELETLVATIVGSADGANGSRFRSALHLFNRGAEMLDLDVSYLLAGSGKSDLTSSLELMPRETRWYGDIFSGNGLASADLAIRRGVAPFGLVHVYNQLVEEGVERGTTGLLQPLVDSSRAIAAGERAVLIAPADPVATRFNIGVRTFGEPVAMGITVRSASGEIRAAFGRSFLPSHFSHLSAAEFLGRPLSANDSITIQMLDGSAIVYGAATDNVTNDPNIQFAQRVAAGAETRRILPVVGSTPGAFGSRFRTGVQLHNADEEPRTATFTFHPNAVSKSFTIEPKATIAIDDLLPAMDLEGLGSADLVASPSVAAVVRVFNDGEGETSMMEEPVEEANVLAAGTIATTLAPHEPSNARFNIGIRALDEGAKILATVRSREGIVVEERELVLGPNQFQHTSAQDATGHVFTGDESIVWMVTEGRAVIYGVWTDNVTNDPSFHYAR